MNGFKNVGIVDALKKAREILTIWKTKMLVTFNPLADLYDKKILVCFHILCAYAIQVKMQRN